MAGNSDAVPDVRQCSAKRHCFDFHEALLSLDNFCDQCVLDGWSSGNKTAVPDSPSEPKTYIR